MYRLLTTRVLNLLAAVCFATALQAQESSSDTSAAKAVSATAHEEHVKPMMQDMTKKMNEMIQQGDADANFAMMMKHHHQSGIDMAREYLKHGKDEKLRVMAEKMIAQQEKEKKELEERQQKNEKNGSSSDNKSDKDTSADTEKKQ